ncbi:MAG: serine/threonine-protein kinase [Gammaproteobacteria bacterium]|nr:serine/threonine-protein kinase [Gammaproteobacteria bacterium]
MNLSYWKKDWAIALLVALVFLICAMTDSLRGLDKVAYDWGVRFSSNKKPNQNVVVVAIDDAALQQMGSWPWPRDIMADLTRQIVSGHPNVIGYALSFDTRQSSRSLDALGELKSAVNQSSAIRLLLRKVEAGLDTDREFAKSLKKAGRIVMAVPYQHQNDGSAQDELLLSEDVKRYGIQKIKNIEAAKERGWLSSNPVPVAGLAFPPIIELSKFAGALGHIQLNAPSKTSGRLEPLVVRAGDTYLPSFSLMMAARSKRLMTRHVKVELEKQISLSGFRLETDRDLQLYSSFYSGESDISPFKVYSILDVLNEKVSASAFKNKLVLIGLTARQQANLFKTPLGIDMPPVMLAAHRVSALLNGDVYKVPVWSGYLEIVLILVIGLYLAFVLPRFRPGTGLALSILLLVILFNTHFVFMMAKMTWLQLMIPTMVLFFGHTILGIKHVLEDRIGKITAELSDANRSLGQSFQSQGQLDQAFEKYRRCDVDNTILDSLYNLGLDYERRRQFNKAVTVFKFIAEHDAAYSDVTDRIKRNQEVTDVMILGSNSNNPMNGTLILSNPGVQKPMLGRYQIDRELGRGAMGMVYLGHDPKIGRTVAIKTMLLSQEFEGEQLEDVKRRFFREAETAGRLNHPNIVTIYDVGEDQDLSYIAMDYLKGDNLLANCKPESLLPADTVFELIMQVADALDFAHKQNIVHRDIKPANIIYDPDKGTLKVTDFGVACVTDASKTKTGTILGSPSYMSPEQLAGKKVDGRSDIFSLGVTLYQMLTGELPFIGESLASLMYKIANEKHPDVRMFRPDLPPCVSKLVNKALHKDIERRFQSGEKMAASISRCLERL